MGTDCEIRCGRCGARFALVARCDASTAGCGGYVETEQPMRCPVCRHRLNASSDEFRSQMEVVRIWNGAEKREPMFPDMRNFRYL